MKPSLREVLADSHVAAVAVAVLLLSVLGDVGRALLQPLLETAEYLVTAVAIRDFPYPSLASALTGRIMLTTTLALLSKAAITFAASWLLSHCTSGAGPLRVLSNYRARLAGGKNV